MKTLNTQRQYLPSGNSWFQWKPRRKFLGNEVGMDRIFVQATLLRIVLILLFFSVTLGLVLLMPTLPWKFNEIIGGIATMIVLKMIIDTTQLPLYEFFIKRYLSKHGELFKELTGSAIIGASFPKEPEMQNTTCHGAIRIEDDFALIECTAFRAKLDRSEINWENLSNELPVQVRLQERSIRLKLKFFEETFRFFPGFIRPEPSERQIQS